MSEPEKHMVPVNIKLNQSFMTSTYSDDMKIMKKYNKKEKKEKNKKNK